MKITIENYRNIRALEMVVEEGKSNFLYGVSGTGKSSIIKALSKEAIDDDCPIGSVGAVAVVRVDGNKPDYSETRVYDEAMVKSLILEPIENEDAYDALIGDDSELKDLERQYADLINDLDSHKEAMIRKKDAIEALLDLFGSRDEEGSFASGSGIEKIKKELSKHTVPTTRALTTSSAKYLKFVTDGTKFPEYDDGKCPFCKKELSRSRKARTEVIKTATKSTFKIIFDSASLFAELGIDEPDWSRKRSVSKFEKELDRQQKVLQSLLPIIEFCNANVSIRDYSAPTNIKASKELLEEMPQLAGPIESINRNSSDYKKLIGNMKKSFNVLMRSKAKVINQQLRDIGIPYVVASTKSDRSVHKVSYVIKHVKDSSQINRGELLSTGEKNVLALLIFLEDPSGGILLFDDPVSSYDGYRRGQLYKRIVGKRDKTIIVCSHDQAFVKQAIVDKNKKGSPNKSIGCTTMLVNDCGRIRVEAIDEHSFGSIRNFVLDHIRALGSGEYFRLMANLRLICEFDRFGKVGDKKKAAWGYTSAILHGATRADVLDKLEKRGYSENDMIELFAKEYGVDIPPVPEHYETKMPSTCSSFEKAIGARESKGISAADKSILNDIVHMNNSLAICLNPYKYSDYPAHIIERINMICA